MNISEHEAMQDHAHASAMPELRAPVLSELPPSGERTWYFFLESRGGSPVNVEPYLLEMVD